MLQLHRCSCSLLLAIREEKWQVSIYFHILMDNILGIFSLYSIQSKVNDGHYIILVFLRDTVKGLLPLGIFRSKSA